MKNVCRVSSCLTLALLVATSCSSAFGWWEDKEGEVSITSGNVYITENDKPSAAVTNITIGYGAKLWVTNLTTKWTMTTPISGNGGFNVQNCADNLIINANNRSYTGYAIGQPGCFAVKDAQTSVIISNRYGLGSHLFKNAASGCSANSFKFGGNGLTNDVAINISSGAFTPQWPNETGTFVQKASLSCGSCVFRNVEITAGVFGNGNLTTIDVAQGCSLTVGTNVHVLAGIGTTSGAVGFGAITATDGLFYWGSAGTNMWRYAQINGANTRVVCIGKNALNTASSLKVGMGYLNVHNKVDKPTLDMNGYDQRLPWISTHSGNVATTRLLVTSVEPATLTFTCRDTSAVKSGSLYFDGAASFCYAGVTGSKYQLQYSTSTSTGTLSVTRGTLELGIPNGSASVTWRGPSVVAAGTGRLILTAKSNKSPSVTFTCKDADNNLACVLEIRDSAEVEIPTGTTVKVGFLVAGGVKYRKGVYGGPDAFAAGLVDADHTVAGIAGGGLLDVAQTPKGGFTVFIR